MNRTWVAPMYRNEADRQRLDRELARIRPLLESALPARQEELLDEAFARAELDPSWAEWSSVADLHLPSRRARGSGGAPRRRAD